jgi:hypothetical protein
MDIAIERAENTMRSFRGNLKNDKTKFWLKNNGLVHLSHGASY